MRSSAALPRFTELHFWPAIHFGLLILVSSICSAQGAVTTAVVDVPVGNHSQRFLYVKPDVPIANVLSLAGGDGILGIQSDGSMTHERAACHPVVRVRQALAERGLAVALVDVNSLGEAWNYDDMLAVIQHMRGRNNVPTWVIGGNNAPGSVTGLALNLPADIPGGVIYWSPSTPPTPTAGRITRPSQVIYHTGDVGVYGPDWFRALTSASAKELVPLSGGSSAGCGYNRFAGLDDSFAAAIVSFIEKNNPPVAATQQNYTALWWNPAENGWGVNFAHQGNILFGTLYTYDAAGAPLWLMMSNGAMQADGVTFTGDLYRTTGPAFNANPFTPITAANLTKVGTMTASFVDANSGTLSYTVNGAQVNKTIQRLVYGSRAANCLPSTASRVTSTNYQDLWWNAAESGWGVNVTHQDNTLFATLFTYDATGEGLWLVMSGGVRQADGSYQGTLYRSSGPAFNANPFTPITEANLTTVGTMRFAFADGERGTLTYTVNGAPVTKAITRLVFSSPVPLCN